MARIQKFISNSWGFALGGSALIIILLAVGIAF